MSGRHSRNKGYRYEAELVNAFKELGLKAVRVPLSGGTDYAKGDVEVIAGFDGKTKYLCEAKRRKNLPKWAVDCLGDNDALVMRGDRGESLVVLRFETFAELLQ